MVDRDFMSELEEYVAARIPDGDFVAPALAADIVRELKDKSPDLLMGWLLERAPSMVAQVLSSIRSSRRARMRRGPRINPFTDAMKSYEKGNPAALRTWLDESTYRTDGGIIRRLGDMTAADCRVVAESYRVTAATSEIEALFFDALALKCDREGKRVREFMDDNQLHGLRDAIERQYAATGQAQVA